MTSIGETLTRKLLEGRPFPAIVVQVMNYSRKVVINRGSVDGVRLGQRFLVYGIGPVITDPETGTSLGKLEMLRGTGEVVHIQERMATIESTSRRAIEKRTRTEAPLGGLLSYGQFLPPSVEVTSEPEMVPFELPEEGDFAKPI